METERIDLSQRQRDRLRVLHEIRQKQRTQMEAARRLKISDRLGLRQDLRLPALHKFNEGCDPTGRYAGH
jgi:hypothetical protein